MYSTCLYCHAALGSNEALERFPVGRTVAFDGERGRLWAVCGTCRRWNLAPLLTRWEAIEDAERLFRDARMRASTENIGLAHLPDGTSLIRVGRPLLPEFAGWRYGSMLRKRLRGMPGRVLRARARDWSEWREHSRGGNREGFRAAAGWWAGGAGLFAAGAAFPPLMLVGYGLVMVGTMRLATVQDRLRAQRLDFESLRRRRPLAVVDDSDGNPFVVTHGAASTARLDPRGEDGWTLRLSAYDAGGGLFDGVHLRDRDAVRALRVVLPRANAWGGLRSNVSAAVGEIERVGGPGAFFGHATSSARAKGLRYATLAQLPAPLRLGLEIAANEETERAVAEAELRELERDWRDAEEIAAIADRLLIAPEVEALLARLRGGD